MNDIDERAWWVFEMPASIVYVPAASEDAARRSLVRDCYKDAPVHEWSLIATRFCSRQALVSSLLKSRPNVSPG